MELKDFEELKFVSRAALKLLYAQKLWKINFKNKVVLDLGSSTGGFTQIALQGGARCVFAVDVGEKQMHKTLRQHPALILYEKQDARKLSHNQITEKVDVLLADLSFISIFKVLPYVLKFLKPGSKVLLLFKPQFELGKGHIGKGGIVKKDAPLKQALTHAKEQLEALGFKWLNCAPSPQKGKSGNQEYLLFLEFK